MAKRLKRGFWWRDDKIHTRDPVTGKRTSTGCSDPAAAELWRARRERVAADPVHARASTSTLGRWARKVIAIKLAEKSAGTAHMYGVKLGQLVRLLGAELPMAAFNPPEGAVLVDSYIKRRREEGVKSNTIGHELVALRQVLKYAKRAGEYGGDISAVMPIGFSREYEPVERVLALEHLAALFAGLRDDDQRAWVCMALCFAADEADIHRMRPEDYDPATKLFHVRGTKNKARDAWLPVLPQFQELFDFAYPRLPLEWTRASHGVPDACYRAEIPHVSPKDLRRTTITWMAEHGVAQEMASRFARHVGDQMVRKIYARVRPRVLGALIESQLGTNASQRFTGPLGGTADAGDLKAYRRLFSRGRRYWGGRKAAVRAGAAGRKWTRLGAQGDTPGSHWSGRKSAAARVLGRSA
jgi:integrase